MKRFPSSGRNDGIRTVVIGILINMAIAILAVGSVSTDAAAQSANVSVFATGLNNPRGVKFGPDGSLYVAEGGVGGTSINTVGQCTQVPAPIGPYTTDGPSARISKIDANGNVSTVIDGLPSSQTDVGSGGFVSGVADVAFIGKTLYALIAGAGCSHAFPDFPNSVIRVNPGRSFTPIANLSEFVMNNPVANPEPDDFEPDGTWYSMIAVRNRLFVLEPNHGELDGIAPDHSIHRVIDISASQGHIVPTALTFHGDFFFGNLNTFPAVAGGSNIYETNLKGDLRIVHNGVITVLGVLFDRQGRSYVLETFDVPGFPTPDTGDILRIDQLGNTATIASGLTFPTAMTLGPDGNLYVSNFGFGNPPGAGEIVKVTVPQ